MAGAGVDFAEFDAVDLAQFKVSIVGEFFFGKAISLAQFPLSNISLRDSSYVFSGISSSASDDYVCK